MIRDLFMFQRAASVESVFPQTNICFYALLERTYLAWGIFQKRKQFVVVELNGSEFILSRVDNKKQSAIQYHLSSQFPGFSGASRSSACHPIPCLTSICSGNHPAYRGDSECKVTSRSPLLFCSFENNIRWFRWKRLWYSVTNSTSQSE